MKPRILPVLICVISILFLTSGGSAAPGATPLGTAFTYQGRLDRSGQPFNGLCNFKFSLWDAASDGNPVGTTIDKPGLLVSNGYFTTQLDFGAATFNGEVRWLEVAALCSGDSVYTTIGRQELTAAPYALFAASAPWSGLTGVPSGFWDGVDDNTTYTNGEGLSLVGTTFSINPDATQRRVSDNCATGSTIQTINADGSVDCEVNPVSDRPIPPSGPVLSTLDSSGTAVRYTSITIGSDGLGLISYYIQPNADLGVAHCTDSDCSSATITTLDSSGIVGLYNSITLGKDGLGLISYYDNSNGDLRVLHCSTIPCDSGINNTLDSTGNVGLNTSIIIGTDGLGLISYADGSNNNIKVAHCNDITCTTASYAVIGTYGTSPGTYDSIAIGVDGLGLVSYWNATSDDLMVAHCNDIACSTSSITALDSTGSLGRDNSLTIGEDGLGLISYVDWGNKDLKVAHCSDLACTSGTLSTLDSTGDVGRNTSITIGTDGLGLISYYDLTNGNLKVAHCSNITCTSAITFTLDSSGDVGQYTAISIGIDGLGLISYYDVTNGDLKVAHCSNTFCMPYFRRR